jgi:hypothetical protein
MADDTNVPADWGVLKHGIGYDLVVVEEPSRYVGLDPTPTVLVLGIRCHTCHRTSFHPKDITERYCGACKVFHEEHLRDNEA